jgi:hypothetical protein
MPCADRPSGRNRVYRRICALEELDADHDGIPDVYQRPFTDG